MLTFSSLETDLPCTLGKSVLCMLSLFPAIYDSLEQRALVLEVCFNFFFVQMNLLFPIAYVLHANLEGKRCGNGCESISPPLPQSKLQTSQKWHPFPLHLYLQHGPKSHVRAWGSDLPEVHCTSGCSPSKCSSNVYFCREKLEGGQSD